MNYLDVLIAIPLCWGAYKGFQRGIVFEIAMLFGILLGLYLAFKLSGVFQTLVAGMVDAKGGTLYLITFFVVFIAVVLIMVLLGKFLEQVLKIGKMDTLNKAAGAAFGLVKFLLVVSVLLSVFRPVDARYELLPAKIKSEALLYEPVIHFSQYLFPALKDVQQEFSKHVG
ncbi:MAG: CvpA family protein [Sphingobacteriales bacterium]|jgi:membrane protein required for colicin V production|nr:CvpA family protein [Sphingobacteriales bacterium]